ncbi:lipid-A-disaccharide synthase [Wenzhouxiangella sp. XN79A]|uniref:lipid-A-disaccharide synthase n=1 Tax=Wenzhouxiangella sp. XN79A TaxID=2724193 RepID=UPI00144AE468|nr:lipid-A-disaccharide synthase [Wenzhouxiangella sp. XN79A]NKI35002.1 lipid-A-disaccharide synthase [Wenzhouxiangella sp. XN79A]
MQLVLGAGETSGDQLGAALARSLRGLDPTIGLAGVTGPAMRSAGVDALAGIDRLDVMGLFEVLGHLPRLIRFRRMLKRTILDRAPSAFVGIDAPDFNLGLARQLRRAGLPTAQFVCPSVWAWRGYRIPKIARSLDLMLTLFPFEPDCFAGTGLDCRFVGHPLADALPRSPDRAAARRALDLPADRPIVALLPGSRGGEIARHAALLAATAARIGRDRPDVERVVLLARDDQRAAFLAAAGEGDLDGLRIVADHTRTGLTAADVALAASGTVTLEALLTRTPMVVYYRLPAMTYATARALRLVRTAHVGLPNVLAGRALVPERIQAEATPGRLARDIADWLDDDQRRDAFHATADELHATLARGAADRAAEALIERFGAQR